MADEPQVMDKSSEEISETVSQKKQETLEEVLSRHRYRNTWMTFLKRTFELWNRKYEPSSLTIE